MQTKSFLPKFLEKKPEYVATTTTYDAINIPHVVIFSTFFLWKKWLNSESKEIILTITWSTKTAITASGLKISLNNVCQDTIPFFRKSLKNNYLYDRVIHVCNYIDFWFPLIVSISKAFLFLFLFFQILYVRFFLFWTHLVIAEINKSTPVRQHPKCYNITWIVFYSTQGRW